MEFGISAMPASSSPFKCDFKRLPANHNLLLLLHRKTVGMSRWTTVGLRTAVDLPMPTPSKGKVACTKSTWSITAGSSEHNTNAFYMKPFGRESPTFFRITNLEPYKTIIVLAGRVLPWSIILSRCIYPTECLVRPGIPALCPLWQLFGLGNRYFMGTFEFSVCWSSAPLGAVQKAHCWRLKWKSPKIEARHKSWHQLGSYKKHPHSRLAL